MREIIPSITLAGSSREDVLALLVKYSAFAGSVHIDFMDGMFVPPMSWPFVHQEALGHIETSMSLEAHLMIRDHAFGAELPAAGFARIIGHIENFEGATLARAALQTWIDAGAKDVGMSILPHTSLDKLDPIIDMCTTVQVMGIETIGYQGQPFVRSTYDRVAALKAKYPNVVIAVDGGVSAETIPGLLRAGAQRLVVGSAISKALDPEHVYTELTALLS